MTRARSTSDRVQSWASILVGAIVVVGVGWLTVEQTTSAKPRPHGDAGSDAALVQNTSNVDAAVALTAADAAAPLPVDEPEAGLGALSLSLGDAAALPTGGPRSVKVGIILVQWQGAEGAATSTRSKADALTKAQDLAQQAKGDFRKAVSQGDPGSGEDLGRIPRGTLDPRIEASLFGLEAGSVSDVIETPRGYWIVKRID